MSGGLDPRHQETKETLKSLGIGMMVVGGILAAIGIFDFFSSFGTMRMPSLFILAMIGLPVAGLGAKLAGFGYLGEISRYTSNEVAPAIKDVVEHVRGSATQAPAEGATVYCPSCSAKNDLDARFCDWCGKPMSLECPKCGTANDAESRFCDHCGASFSN